MATLKFQTTTKGYMIFRGNTLGIQNAADNPPDYQGAFITLDPTLSAGAGFPDCTSTTLPGCPAGTSMNWQENGSFSEFTINPTAKLIYAALIWATQNPLDSPDIPITFTTPIITTTIPPDSSFSFNSDRFFTRGAEVTDLVKAGGSGIYSVSGVPSLIPNLGTGWVLAGVFEDETQPVRNMSLFVGSDANKPTTTIPLSGFQAPSPGPVGTRVLVGAQYGDSDLVGDVFKVNSVTISGPKNPPDNFFASQIVDENGNYYNSSFNYLNMTPGSVIPFGRAEYDITNVDATGAIPPGSTSLEMSIEYIVDIVIVNAVGLQLDAVYPNIIMTKSTNKAYAITGDTISYTITVSNTGNNTASNVIFTDILPNGANFVPNSFQINNIPVFSSTLPSGITLPNIGVGSTVTVNFDVTVSTTIPYLSYVSNVSSTSFLSEGGSTIPGAVTSNIVTTTINQAIISTIKSAYPDSVKLGDTITYTVTIGNTGSTSANNVYLTDRLPDGTVLAPGSLNPNPPSSIPVGVIGPSGISTVTFNVIVVTLPTTGTIPNTATTSYTYTADPSVPNGASDSSNSNIIYTISKQAIIGGTIPNSGLRKNASKNYADIGDVITFTIVAQNTGNVPATNVIIIDTIPNGLNFNSGSVMINGAPSNKNPNSGINLGTIPNGNTTTITFTTTVITIPSPNPIQNVASVNYTYTVYSTLPNGSSGAGNTNITTTTINHGEITPNNVIKLSDMQEYTQGDIINYTITAKNTGNEPVVNVLLIDNIVTPTTFVNGSVKVNNIDMIGANPNLGINLGTVPVSSTTTVTFQVLVNSSIPNNIINTATLSYSYYVDPNVLPVTGPIVSTNTITLPNLSSDTQTIKSSDTTGVMIGDSITYTVVVTNNGQIKDTDVIVRDSLNQYLQYTDNLTLNGTTIPGDISSGVDIGFLDVSQSSTITFTSTVISIPANGVISNVANSIYTYSLPGGTEHTGMGTSNINSVNAYVAKLDSTKVSSKQYLTIGGLFYYTVTIKNTGNITVNNAIIKDVIPAQLNVRSIIVDGRAVSGDIRSGINIGDIVPNQTITIIINLEVLTLLNGTFYNVFNVNGTILPDPNRPAKPITSTAIDNIGVQVYSAGVKIDKTANKKCTKIGSTITYMVILTNTGTSRASNVTLIDLLPCNVKLINGSFKINGGVIYDVNLYKGVNIGDIPSRGYVVVNYTVKVISSNCFKDIVNKAYANYCYITGGGATIYDTTDIATSTVAMNENYCTEYNLDKIEHIPSCNYRINCIDYVDGKVENVEWSIVGYNNHDTCKLLVEGVLIVNIEYTSCYRHHGIQYLTYKIPFKTYVYIPVPCASESELNVECIVQDLCVRLGSCREIYIKASIIIDVEVNSCKI